MASHMLTNNVSQKDLEEPYRRRTKLLVVIQGKYINLDSYML